MGLLHEGKYDWVLADTGKKMVIFWVGISLNLFSVKLFAYLNDGKSCTLLGICSSAESKELTNFAICHLLNSLDVFILTSKIDAYTVDLWNKSLDSF